MPAGAPHPIDAPGTDERAWASWPGLSALPELDLLGWESAVVVAAHPDDEVLGAGGILALLAAAGARLRLVAVTDGEASHPGADRVVLARRRAGERAAALSALGLPGAEVIRLGMPDSGVAAREAGLAAALAGLVPGFAACLAPWEDDRHPDHEAAGRAARRACAGMPPGAVLSYPVWTWHWAGPADPRVPWDRAVRVPLPPAARARKRAALACFASQAEDRPGGRGPVLEPGFLAHFGRGAEILFRAAGP
jgi:LmbE family N-acetylglucosaminyl deacetylase